MASDRLLAHDLLPEEWQADSFIAGGFAANRELASDIDLWVSVPTGNDLNDIRTELLDHLRTRGFRFEEQQEVVSGDVLVDMNEGYPIYLDNQKVAVVTGRFGFHYKKPVHIIVTNGDMEQVLEGFDISTHQVALLKPFVTGERPPYLGNDWTPLSEYPVILKDTPHTRERHERIAARYASFRPATEIVMHHPV